MKPSKLIFIFSSCLILLNCSKNDSEKPIGDPIGQPKDAPTLSSAKELNGFSVLESNNADLNIDADVQQSGTELKAYFPANTELGALTINFEVSAKAKLKIDGEEVVSGSTAVNFSAPITLTVEAEDGSTKNYSISSESNFTDLDASIEALRTKYNAPAFQVAITRNEKLVYANSYGYADLNSTEPATNASVFRLASVSKTITAVTVLKMVDDGLLGLDDLVFGANGILEFDFGTAPYGTDIENITVRHLLGHTSGFTNSPNDPLFVNLDWSHAQIITDILDNRSLTTVPGATYSYSNFGYILLGRIIEKVTNMSYEAYVKQSILAPAGISTMNIAGNTISDKHPNEVEYLSQGDNLGPYQYNANRCDAMGGWTASATDLAKYLVTIDRNNTKPDVVSASTLGEMFFGEDQWGFAGSLPGTSAYIWRLNNETNYIILTNTRTLPVSDILTDMREAMANHIWNRSSWPNYDLF